LTLYVWATLFVLAIVYSCLRLFVGAKRVDDFVFGIVERVLRLRSHAK
jgi:uncharacterized protein YggT (Ycf19 family)